MIQNQASLPASTGQKRASRNTPALTIVAECRKAETGVGAAIACGNQKWKGNCALLESAPKAISVSAAGYQGCVCNVVPAASTVPSS